MPSRVVRFVSLFLSGIIAGIYVHGVFSSASTKRLSGPAFTEMAQEVNRDFTRIMPIVGISSLIADMLALLFDRKGRARSFLFTAAALGLNIGATVATVRLNLPHNDEMMTWERDALPPHWRQTRDRWLAASKVRTAFGLLNLSCLILAVQSDTSRGSSSTD